MFTGVIQHVGRVEQLADAPRAQHGAASHELVIDLGPLAAGLALGASVAVNGACLTAAAIEPPRVRFDVVPQTWRMTSLSRLRRGSPVNLERSLRVGDPIDGHFVQGHIDAVGDVDAVERGDEWRLWVRCDPNLFDLIVPQGSIALDGVSLTIAEVAAPRFAVALVPTTLQRTTLGGARPGDRLNIETDILARIVRRRAAAVEPGALWTQLADGGYLS